MGGASTSAGASTSTVSTACTASFSDLIFSATRLSSSLTASFSSTLSVLPSATVSKYRVDCFNCCLSCCLCSVSSLSLAAFASKLCVCKPIFCKLCLCSTTFSSFFLAASAASFFFVSLRSTRAHSCSDSFPTLSTASATSRVQSRPFSSWVIRLLLAFSFGLRLDLCLQLGLGLGVSVVLLSTELISKASSV